MILGNIDTFLNYVTVVSWCEDKSIMSCREYGTMWRHKCYVSCRVWTSVRMKKKTGHREQPSGTPTSIAKVKIFHFRNRTWHLLVQLAISSCGSYQKHKANKKKKMEYWLLFGTTTNTTTLSSIIFWHHFFTFRYQRSRSLNREIIKLIMTLQRN